MSKKPIRILHFADAHIDIANYGKYDTDTYLPVRVMDFLRSLDQIVDRAIAEKVDLVIFAGDAYKDRNPHPTFQKAWGERMMRLSNAGIPTILLVGNHDVSPAAGRAHALHEYTTLNVPYIHVADRIRLLTPAELGVPIQVVAVPWVSRSALMTREESAGKTLNQVLELIESRVIDGFNRIMDTIDPTLPTILTAHASVQGAVFGSERAVMLGHELILGGTVVADKRLDYVALGHIHKHQDVSKGGHPPIVYPGSIERIDFGEVREKKGFVLARVTRGKTDWEFVTLNTRPFRDYTIDTPDADTFMVDVMSQLPQPDDVTDAICRVTVFYPRDWESLLDEAAITERFSQALSFQLVKKTTRENRSRLGDTVAVEEMSPLELLDQYWVTAGVGDEEAVAMQALAQEIFGEHRDHRLETED
jgi:exonuclease SbcD